MVLIYLYVESYYKKNPKATATQTVFMVSEPVYFFGGGFWRPDSSHIPNYPILSPCDVSGPDPIEKEHGDKIG
jgi:hypothetical protein